MATYLVTIALLFGLMVAGIVVDRLYRHFAARHPQLGPFRQNEGGCGCGGSKCDKSDAGCKR
ncbi:hypothetical protein [Sulfuricystis thermophila]|uniref:hypothetical protein n=1 Tax=Sulfuricystis thermophila TaxID=2496847 RepID=UPI0010358987|nr:hypothetical protein [Sulfuricystis thermophila]